MMTIYDNVKFNNHFEDTDQKSQVIEMLFAMLLFGSVGAIAWAIRGTSGWGGVDGTIVPAMMWGVLWYYFAFRKGVDARGIVLWLGLGLAIGGELGYGQYTSWIRGIFYSGSDKISIDPWLGYFWFAMCGIGWAAAGGIVLGWAIGKKVSTTRWIVRSILIIVLLFLLFDWSFIDWLSPFLLKTNLNILFPNADLGIYSGELGKHLSRTVYTNTQNFGVVIWWLVALLEAFINKDRITIVSALILGGGFGLGFMQSAMWALGYGTAPDYIDWWKMWELNSGFNLGVLYVIFFYWAIRNLSKQDKKEENSKVDTKQVSQFEKWRDTLFLACSGAILFYFVGFEYFFWPGLALSVFYLISMLLTTKSSLNGHETSERRKNVSIIFTVFYLLFIMFHGVSDTLGIVLELYTEEDVSQYSWPIERILIFAPFALLIFGVTLIQIRKILNGNTLNWSDSLIPSKLSVRVIDLITVLGFIGALSIWPAKIGIIYALFVVVAIFAFNRLERRFNQLDGIKINNMEN